MDRKTQELRRRAKAQATPRGQLSNFESLGLGVKGRPKRTFPHKRCSHIEGGTLVFFKKNVLNPKTGREEIKRGAILKGGTACVRIATKTITVDGVAKGYCPEHRPEPKSEDG